MSTDQLTGPRLLMPGLPTPGPGTERYHVRGASATALSLAAGDIIEIIDVAGRQSCELVAFDRNGRSNPGLLGAPDHGTATGAQAILDERRTDARRVRSGLEAVGLDLSTATMCSVFPPDSLAGERQSFTASESISVIVSAPGNDMDSHQQNTPTELLVFVHRATVPERGEIFLPMPLADMTQDILVERRTAYAFEVKAGEFIQIIDIEGRECSDFRGGEPRIRLPQPRGS